MFIFIETREGCDNIMNIWTIICLAGAILFGLLAAIFAILKEKGVKYFHGYKDIPNHEKKKYDKAAMVKAMRDEMLNWTGILLIGTLLSQFSTKVYGIIALFLWVIVFIVKVFSDPKEELKKYKKY